MRGTSDQAEGPGTAATPQLWTGAERLVREGVEIRPSVPKIGVRQPCSMLHLQSVTRLRGGHPPRRAVAAQQSQGLRLTRTTPHSPSHDPRDRSKDWIFRISFADLSRIRAAYRGRIPSHDRTRQRRGGSASCRATSFRPLMPTSADSPRRPLNANSFQKPPAVTSRRPWDCCAAAALDRRGAPRVGRHGDPTVCFEIQRAPAVLDPPSAIGHSAARRASTLESCGVPAVPGPAAEQTSLHSRAVRRPGVK